MTNITMHAMLKRLKVDTLEFAYARLGAVYTQAREDCRTCGHAEACAIWLREDSDQRPDFCPNIETFERYLEQS